MRFRTTIQQTGKNTTGIQVPEDVMAALGSGKRPAVTVTVNGTATAARWPRWAGCRWSA